MARNLLGLVCAAGLTAAAGGVAAPEAVAGGCGSGFRVGFGYGYGGCGSSFGVGFGYSSGGYSSCGSYYFAYPRTYCAPVYSAPVCRPYYGYGYGYGYGCGPRVRTYYNGGYCGGGYNYNGITYVRPAYVVSSAPGVYIPPPTPTYSTPGGVVVLGRAESQLDNAAPSLRATTVAAMEPAAPSATPAATPPARDLARGWALLGDGDGGRALAQFGALCAEWLDYGPSKVGYAFAASMSGDDERAAWAMRRAFRMDPDRLMYVPVDRMLRTRLQDIAARYGAQVDRKPTDQDALFMVAATSYFLGDRDRALFSIDKAIDAGDDTQSSANLRRLVAGAATAPAGRDAEDRAQPTDGSTQDGGKSARPAGPLALSGGAR